MPHRPGPAGLCCLLIAGGLALATGVGAADGAKKFAVAAVQAQVAKDYQRKKNADGSFVAEYYVFSFGGQVDGTTTDDTVDHVNAGEFAELLRRHLATQNYVLAAEVKDADLVLRVHWGRTIPYGGSLGYATATDSVSQALTTVQEFNTGIGEYVSPEQQAQADAASLQLENAMIMMMAEKRARERANEFNARLLGYQKEMQEWAGSPALLAGAAHHMDELEDDLEEARYYLVVLAFDRRAMTAEQAPRLRWVTRISIRAPGHRFDENLARMIERAGRHFGRDSRGLVRRYEGTVELGEPEVIGVVEDAEPEAPTGSESPRETDDGGKP